MVLSELGNRLTAALRNVQSAPAIDESTLNEMLKEIGNALVASDVNVQLVLKLRQSVKAKVGSLEKISAGISKANVIRKAVFEGLCDLLDPKVEPFKPVKGKPNVLMMVGLQGAGKTTTVTKLAYWYKRKGFKPGLVCADTFRAGAFAQLKQNATKAKIPFYGSEDNNDPVKVASEGVEMFKKEGSDLIIVDTSGRHKQESELFVEMESIANAIQPSCIIFVMDASIGQAALGQAQAFKSKVDVGSVIVTKLDGHAKGGGALSAVAATNSPIVFIGTGERIPDIEPFSSHSFVQRLLGMGNIEQLVETVNDVVSTEQQKKLQKKFTEGKLTLRDFQEQMQAAMKMGPIENLIQMFPGFSNMQLPAGVDTTARLRRIVNIFDSMTKAELDNRNLYPLSPSRVNRIARGSGTSVEEVQMLLAQFKMISNLKPNSPLFNQRGGLPNMNSLKQLSGLLPQGMLNQIGGASGLQDLMKQFSMADMKQMQKMMMKK